MAITSSLNILITGSAQGIGRTLARYFLSKGHKIFLIDVKKNELQHSAERHLSGKVGWHVNDLSSVQQIREAVRKAAD
jgi:NAD(P)-dependent dehydrogenase (short-subunit alcohol dehydrogenase family)